MSADELRKDWANLCAKSSGLIVPSTDVIGETMRLVPERTIDSLFAYEALQALPTSLIWSPANTAGMWDHAVVTSGGSMLVIECKALDGDRTNHRRSWRVPIDRAQLQTYLRLGVDLTYLLPARPQSVGSPWVRKCAQDPSPGGFCLACYTPSSGNARRWSGQKALWQHVEPHLRLQPWFNHWSWCVRASDLEAHLVASGRKGSVKAADVELGAIAGADRLCHVLADAEAASAGAGGGRATKLVVSTDGALDVTAVLSNLEAAVGEEVSTPPLLVTF